MTIDQKVDKSTVVLILSGRLDAVNASLLERKIKQWGDEITELILDFTEISYISSVGLRVLLHAKKVFKKENKKLVIKNIGETVREVFEMTGFINLLVHEERFVLIRKEQDSQGVVLSFNGEMLADDNVKAVEKELSDIRKKGLFWETPFTVVFDMANLIDISSRAAALLKEAVQNTAWEKRTIKVRDASSGIRSFLEFEGFGGLCIFTGR